MFGLDARIAVLIFGILSLISSAYIYRTIDTVYAVSIVKDLEEVLKGVDQYVLDTGHHLPRFSGGINYIHSIGELYTNSENVAGWDGPYSRFPNNTERYLTHNKYGNITLYHYAPDTALGGVNGVDALIPTDCNSSVKNTCAYWVGLNSNSVQDRKIFENVDEYVDGAIDYKSGRVRIYIDEFNLPHLYFMGTVKKYE